MPRRPALGALFLFAAAVLWGLAFVPQKLTVVTLPVFAAISLRFLFALPVGLASAWPARHRTGVKPSHALSLGALLFCVYILQTAALNYTSVTRVCLITGLYSVFVPLFGPLVKAPRASALHWLGAGVAMTGLLLLVGVLGKPDQLSGPLNLGDALVLGHAVLSAFHILFVGKLAPKAEPFALNALQLIAMVALAVPLGLLVDGWVWPHFDLELALGYLYLSVFSTVLGFTCQIAGQRHASPATAAVVMLLETPVGVLGSQFFFHEQLSASQWVGGAVLFLGVVVSLSAEFRRRE